VFFICYPSLQLNKRNPASHAIFDDMKCRSTLRETSAFPVFFLFLTRKLVNKFKVDPLDDVKKNTAFAENLVL